MKNLEEDCLREFWWLVRIWKVLVRYSYDEYVEMVIYCVYYVVYYFVGIDEFIII